jgi:hypothetical protein
MFETIISTGPEDTGHAKKSMRPWKRRRWLPPAGSPPHPTRNYVAAWFQTGETTMIRSFQADESGNIDVKMTLQSSTAAAEASHGGELAMLLEEGRPPREGRCSFGRPSWSGWGRGWGRGLGRVQSGAADWLGGITDRKGKKTTTAPVIWSGRED